MIAKISDIEDIKNITPEEEKAAAAELENKLKHREKTRGEKWYNRGVYTGIGWVANEIGSMAFTGMFERGNNKIFGRERFEQWAEKLAPKFNKTDLTKGRAKAKDMLMWASLNVVGSLVVPAIKIVDGHKAFWVKKLNHWFDDKNMSQEQVAARDREVAIALAAEPTQSWTTLIIGRLVGMAAAISNGTYILGYKNKKDPNAMSGNDHIKHYFDKGLSAVGSKIGIKAATTGKNNFETRPQPAAHEMNAFHYYAGLAGPETVGCAVTSVILEGVSKPLAKKLDPHVRDQKLRNETIREIALKKRKSITPREEQYAQQISAEELVSTNTAPSL